MSDLKQLAIQVHNRLLDFYGQPVWRTPLPPVDELISTILSQNTNDLNRDRAFDALCKRFKNWEEIINIDTDELISIIRPAGLANQKAPRIQQVLREIVAERGDLDLTFLKDWPLDQGREWLTHFKGVGPKTAAIVLLFSLGLPAFPVDTHIYRVTGRIGLRPEKMDVETSHIYLENLFPQDSYYAAHLNIIQLGRQVCTSRKTNCSICPLQVVCNFTQNKRI